MTTKQKIQHECQKDKFTKSSKNCFLIHEPNTPQADLFKPVMGRLLIAGESDLLIDNYYDSDGINLPLYFLQLKNVQHYSDHSVFYYGD